MILEEIILHNFGVYKGRQSLTLTTPSQKKPVILIGGLNGGGKTTLLDAVHLSFYGKRARCSNRGSLNYDDYLRRGINRSVSPNEGAALEIQFRQRTEGVEQTWRVQRSWSVTNDNVTERLEIIRGNVFDRVMTEAWLEVVEEFIPVEISSLFFFDGEKIEGFADLENSTQLLSKAVHSLLGLDLVDRLAMDLMALERRKQTGQKTETDQKQIEAAATEIARLEEFQADLISQRGVAQNNHERRLYDLRKIEERFRREGGDLYERREQLEAQRKVIAQQLQNIEAELREIVEGAAPLLLVGELLQAVDQQDQQEETTNYSQITGTILEERDEWFIEQVRFLQIPNKLLNSIITLLLEDRNQRKSGEYKNRHLNLTATSRHDLRTLRSIILPEVMTRTVDILQQADELRSDLDEADRRLAGVPAESAIADLIKERQQAELAADSAFAHLKLLEMQIEQINRDLEQKRAAHASLIEKSVEAKFEEEDVSRVIIHSQKVRKTLGAFRGAVVERHVERIARLVLDSYRQLLRKQSLISELKIDPQTFALELYGQDGKLLQPDRLSAGERQLLAVSLLWGLARASGRPLPAIIDTPLGRLDASHRTNLIERYFPNASHQVLLLSTDEEIDKRYYEQLKPWVGRTYLLDFDDTTGATHVKPGYFWE